MKCPKCGIELEAGARFCGGCGAKLQPAAAAPPGGPVLPGAMKTMVAGSGGMGMPPVAPPPVAPPAPAAPRPVQRAAPAPLPLPSPVAVAGDPFVGKTLNNRYLIETKLGEGGFGAVYKGRQLQIGREVALKLLHPDMARDPNLVARFRREGAVSCSLRDAHTITTYDFDQTPDGMLYIAMELLKGRSLHDVFQDEAPIEWARVLRVLEQMCSSLGEAHTQGIVHRDLKPENIYLEPRPGQPEFVKILDFGIAKIVSGEIGSQSPQLTASGQTLGTLEYMSPEQLMGKPLDGRSDIYAMGVLAYELLTGRLPFPDAQGPAALIAAQLKKTPPPPSVARPDAGIPPGVDQLVLRMLEKDKNKRFVDVAEMARACQQILAAGGAAIIASASPAPAASAPGVAAPPPVAAPRLPTPHPAPLSAPAGAPAPPRSAPVPRMSGPSTEQALAAATGSGKAWLWIVLAVVAIGGGAGAYFAFLR